MQCKVPLRRDCTPVMHYVMHHVKHHVMHYAMQGAAAARRHATLQAARQRLPPPRRVPVRTHVKHEPDQGCGLGRCGLGSAARPKLVGGWCAGGSLGRLLWRCGSCSAEDSADLWLASLCIQPLFNLPAPFERLPVETVHGARLNRFRDAN